MKEIRFVLLMIVSLALMVGCEDGAAVKVVNQTSYNVYGEIDGEEFTVAGNSNHTVDVDTDEKVFLIDDGVTKKTIKLEGETFRIWDYYEETPHNETEIKVTPGKTYKVYCKPNSASVKVVNNSDYAITKLRYRKNTQFSTGLWFMVTYDPPLESGEFAYYHLLPQTEENRFFYNFEVIAGDELVYEIGNEFEGVMLFMDDQHLISIEND